ncbi:Two component regulator propeller [Ostertagia ostertagi]
MALQGGGLAIYNRETGQLSYKGNNIEHESAIDRYSDIAFSCNFLFDSKGRFWFSGWGTGFPYVYCYDVRSQQPVFEKYEFISIFKSYNEVNGFFEQKDSTIWIMGLKVFGRYLEAEKKFELVLPGYQNERSIDYRQITALCEDKESNIWVGTGNNGLFRFNPSQEYFTNIRHTSRTTGTLGDGNPLSYLQEKDGSLLVGTWGDGIYRYDKNFNNIPLGIKGIPDRNFVSVWDIFPSSDGNIAWFSCQPGIYKYSRQQRTAVFINPPALTNRTVRQIAEDRKGNLWLGMQKIGLFKWDALKGKNKFDEGISKFDAISNVTINNITIDSKGYVWVATSIDGLYVIDPENDTILMHFHDKAKKEQRLIEEGVAAVLEYNDSLMVITTPTRVLIYNRNNKRTRILGSGETMSGFIASLQRDSIGNLWISTTAALYRANIKTRVFVRFNRDDGITNDFFVLSSSYKLPDGRVQGYEQVFAGRFAAAIAAAGVTGQAAQIGSGGYILLKTFPDTVKYANGYKSLPKDTLSNLGSFTLAFWMKGVGPVKDGAQGLFSISNKNEFWGNLDLFLENNDNGSEGFLKIHMFNSAVASGNGEQWNELKIPNMLNKWTHVAVRYDAATSQLSLLIDGAATAINNRVLAGGNYGKIKFKDFNGMVLGTYQFQTSPTLTNHGPESWAKSFNGALDQFRLYNRPLSNAEIADLFTTKK